MDKPASDDYIGLCIRNNTHYNPTLSTCVSQTREGHEMQVRFATEPLAGEMLLDKRPRQPLGMAGDAPQASIANAYESVKALYSTGLPILVGSDASGQARGTAYGLGVHMEIYSLTYRIGMSAIDVLKGATSSAADRFGFHDRGKIEAGLRADMVLIKGDVRNLMADEDVLCLPLRVRDGILASAYKNNM